MDRQDITTLVSHYIPNEGQYYLDFPLRILNKYNGPGNLDVTIDDNLMYFIIKPLLDNEVEYNYNLKWNTEHKNNWYHSLTISLKVNDNKFDHKFVIKNIAENNMLDVLTLKKQTAHGQLVTIFQSK